MPTDIEQAIERGHPAANRFPMLGDAELWDMAHDIGKNGLKEPIEVYEGLILDGRNRWVACMRAGVVPRSVVWEGDSPTAHVVSKNLKRRHLSPSQRSAFAAEMEPLIAAELKAKEHIRKTEGSVALMPQSSEGRARDLTAEEFAVSPRYVQDAKRLRNDDPDTFERVKAGEMTLPEAKRASPAFVMPEREEASPEERAYYALSRQRMVVSLDPAAVAGFCADAGLSLESFRALEAWLGRFNAALGAAAESPLHVVR